jgi:hypothetical protein
MPWESSPTTKTNGGLHLPLASSPYGASPKTNMTSPPDPFDPSENNAFIEAFTQNEQSYKYSFTYILMTLKDNTMVDRGAILNRIVPGTNSKMVGIEISNQSIINKEPMRLLITDMTVYERGQPLLELNLLINKQREHVIPAHFMTSWTQVPINRQVDMTIPPIGSLQIDFAGL